MEERTGNDKKFRSVLLCIRQQENYTKYYG